MLNHHKTINNDNDNNTNDNSNSTRKQVVPPEAWVEFMRGAFGDAMAKPGRQYIYIYIYIYIYTYIYIYIYREREI